jgi:hypothetical protein
MKENTYKRRLDKKLNNSQRDSDGESGDARRLNKANREYGKALIDVALEKIDEHTNVDQNNCEWCGDKIKTISLFNDKKFCSEDCVKDWVAWEQTR